MMPPALVFENFNNMLKTSIKFNINKLESIKEDTDIMAKNLTKKI